MADRRPQGEALSEEEIQDLLRVAHAAAVIAHSPYSKVQTGAALLTADGQVFTGCTVENASFGLSTCAERVAVLKSVSAGVRRFRALAIATTLDRPVLPCGACRQVLREFAEDLAVICQGREGPRVQARLVELLPRPFLPSDAV